MSAVPNESCSDATTRGAVTAATNWSHVSVNVFTNAAESGISTIRLRYSSVNPRAMLNPGRTLWRRCRTFTLLRARLVDLVERAAVLEVRLRRLLPAAERVLD